MTSGGIVGRTLLVSALTGAGLPSCSGSGPQLPSPDPGMEGEPGPSLESFAIPGHGHSLIARLLVPAGPGLHPLVILLHGFPGNESNFDLAHVLRRRGWAAAVFHYRGSWGSAGRFAFSNVLEDVHSAVDHLRRPRVAATFRIDPSEVYLVGHSMGGFAALHVAAERDDVAGAASLAGFNFGASAEAVGSTPGLRAAMVEAFEDALLPLNAPSGETLVQEYLDRGADWDLRTRAGDLGSVPLLLVGATADEVAPVELHHDPLVRALAVTGHPAVQALTLDDGHGFSRHRLALAEILSAWLAGLEGRK